jgi:uncharacterized membrane protein YraQ (UPF0718 family)
MADQTDRGPGAPQRGGWWFLAAMLLLHVIVGWLDPALGAASIARFVSALTDLLPLFVVMFLLLWLFNLYIRPGPIVKRLGRAAGIRGWVLSVAAGVLSMGSMYLWYPLLGQLRSQGLRPGLAAAFLYSRAIKIPMLPFMAHYFGAAYSALFVICVLLFSVLGGAAIERLEDSGQTGLDSK